MDPRVSRAVESRPEGIKKLCYEFPIGMTIDLEGTVHHLLGYNEGEMLILSPIDPYLDYDGANESKVYLCAQHIRDAMASQPDRQGDDDASRPR